MFILICSTMVLLANVGFIMKETGVTNLNHTTALLVKTILVVSVSTISFFVIGFGLSVDAKGGLLGDRLFFGFNYDYDSYTKFVFYLSLCVMMSVVATGGIAERVDNGLYVFFGFVTAGFIFPLGLAWAWEDGWLQ